MAVGGVLAQTNICHNEQPWESNFKDLNSEDNRAVGIGRLRSRGILSASSKRNPKQDD